MDGGIEVQHVPGSALFSNRNISHGWYNIHDNGGTPFRVKIGDDTITIEGDTTTVVKDYRRAFIGKSPLTEMTKFSSRHGHEFDGNTILIHLESGRYLYIGKNLKYFRTEDPIVSYTSEVGNSDVPYPYAVDSAGRYYLLIEDAVLKTVRDPEQPYESLYRVPKDRLKELFGGIRGFSGATDRKEVFWLTVNVDPVESYMDDLHAVQDDGSSSPVTLEEYVEMNNHVNKSLGISRMQLIY